jgi:uncharacterized protein
VVAPSAAVLAAEVADDDKEQDVGLSGRDALSWSQGMLFDFGRTRDLRLSVRETSIALSIAFLDDGGTVINIQDMGSMSELVDESPRPYRWVIEANAGWFAAANVRPGDRLILCR